MNQGDLAAAVAEGRKGDAAEAVLATIRDGLERDGKVTIAGFGSFETSRREAREGRDPRTGKPVQVAASTTVRFRPGKGLKDVLNGGA